MPTINRDGTEFPVYADVQMADTYALGSMDSAGWDAANDDTKERSLITSTRILDRQIWIPELDTFEERELNQNIIDASIEMSFMIVDGSDLETNASAGAVQGPITSLRAGSVGITYGFSASSATAGSSTTGRWPLPIEEKLRGLLAGTSGTATGPGGAVVYGTEGESVNNNTFDLARGY